MTMTRRTSVKSRLSMRRRMTFLRIRKAPTMRWTFVGGELVKSHKRSKTCMKNHLAQTLQAVIARMAG